MSLRIFTKQHATDQSGSLWDQHPKLLPLILVSMFLLAGAARLYRSQAPGMLPERDFGSAILARDIFYRHTDTVPDWEKGVSRETVQNIPLLEPPATEYLVSILYRVAGSEQWWMARLVTSVFWLLGGIFLYKIAKMFLSTGTAVVSTAYYLFAPLGILLSRSFQPDALMMLLFLVSLFTILKYYEHPSKQRLVLAGIITGLTLLYRPTVLFTLFAAFAALGIAEQRSWKGAFRQQTAIFFTMGLLPPMLYYGYGALITDGKQALMSFQPYLFLQKEYWKGWFDLGIKGVGTVALVTAILGLAVLPSGWPLALLLGLWFGYFIFGLTFTYHIHTHPYYQAQLIPIVALSFGPLVGVIASRLKENSLRRYWLLPLTALLMLAMFLSLRQVRDALSNQLFVREETAQTIGKIVQHSSKTVYVARNYGVPLQYYGELTGSYWPRRSTIPLHLTSDGRQELTVAERLKALDFTPEYFIITDFGQFSKHHADLKDFLATSCSLLAGSDEYQIYTECADQNISQSGQVTN